MDSTKHPANPRKKNQHNSIQIYQCLYELHLSVITYFCRYLTYQGRMASFQDLSYIQDERLSRLHWSHPEEPEWETISFIRRKMKELMQNKSLRRRETSPYQLLIEVSSNLWTYFQFNGRVRVSRCHDQEWDEIALSNTIEDCESVAQTLQQETALIQQNESYKEEISELYEPLGRILHYLKQRTIRGSQFRDAPATSHDEDKALEELDWVLR